MNNLSDIIEKVRSEIIKRIDQYEEQNKNHMDDINNYEEKIKHSKEKQSKVQQHLDEARNELHKINEFINWKSDSLNS